MPNVTEVAVELGYPFYQAFSAQFRRLIGVSPTAYLHQIAAMPELTTSRFAKARRQPNGMLYFDLINDC
jgi:AraC-like DNA-binding protein